MASAPPLNILIVITDQQRTPQHWPPGWEDRNLPSFRRLQRHGLTFRRAYTGACMCSPSRAALWTGQYPWVNGVRSTGGTLEPNQTLPNGAPLCTLGQVMKDAGYVVGFRGKWHLGNSPTEFGFGPWDPPDDGTASGIGPTQGAGAWDNDQRVLGTAADPDPPGTHPHRSALSFLREYARRDKASGKPFFLVVSLVNPHDVGIATSSPPSVSWPADAGYDPSLWANLDIEVPKSVSEDLSTKPSIQTADRNFWGGPTWSPADQKSYVQFYAYLQTLVDQDVMRLLQALDHHDLTGSTLIVRTADHGELGLAHGLVHKGPGAYEESIHVPLIFSNPRLFPEPVETDALASLLDVTPTITSIAGVSPASPPVFVGTDLSPLFTDPSGTVQSEVLFTFDDATALHGQGGDPVYHVRCVREAEWKLCVYFDDSGQQFEYEMYDLRDDPHELRNLANPANARAHSQAHMERLDRILVDRMNATCTKPCAFPWPKPPIIGDGRG